MAAKSSTFIKLDRNITDWRWYQNANTFRVFVHILIKANIAPHDFEGTTIQRGEFATSYEKLGESLGLSVGQVRTAISHLKSTGEITTRKYPKYQVITVLNYNSYQGNQQAKQHSNNSQITVNQQSIDNNQRTYKEPIENEKKRDAPSEQKPEVKPWERNPEIMAKPWTGTSGREF